MTKSTTELSVRELFELSRPPLGSLSRSEQLQSLMCRLVWNELRVDPDRVVEVGKQKQQMLRRTQPWRSYLDDWDELLDDCERLFDLLDRYHPDQSGLLSNSPLRDVIDRDERFELHQMLINYRANAAA